MPQMANITVKKADGATNVIWVSKVPAAGDKSPAVWKNDSVSTTPAARPDFHIASEDGASGAARRLRFSGRWPLLRTDSNGNPAVKPGVTFTGSALINQSMTIVEIKEACAQYANILASALIQECFSDGFAAI